MHLSNFGYKEWYLTDDNRYRGHRPADRPRPWQDSRRMILLFSRKYGKISVGTSAAEGGKNKSALAARPFTYGRYELFKGRDSYNLNNGQVIKSYYGIGEDLDKYHGGIRTCSN